MLLSELLQRVRTHPEDRAQRTVLADALLATGDPRGELMAAQLAGRAVAPEVLERCIERVRAAVPGLERVRFEHGLVSEIELDFQALADVDLDWLEGEPLVRVRSSAPARPYAFEQAFERGREVLRSCRGLHLDSGISAELWPVLAHWVIEIGPRYLGLDIIPDQLDEVPPPWPSVEVSSLRAERVVWEQLLPRMPNLRKLEQRNGWGLGPAYEHGGLRHLDMRELPWGEGVLRGISKWSARQDCEVRYPAFRGNFGLGGPDMDDVFGCSGLSWSVHAEPRSRVVAIPGERLGFAVARGAWLGIYREGEPAWEREIAAPIGALGARAGELIVGREDGIVELHDPRQAAEPRVLVRLPGAVRSISVHDQDLALVHASGWWAQVGGEVQAGAEPLTGLVATPAGLVRARGSVVTRGEASFELGETVSKLVLEGSEEHLLIMAGRQVWRLRGDRLEVTGARGHARYPGLAADGVLFAWTAGRRSVAWARPPWHEGPVHERVVYPDRYHEPGDLELAVADVAVLSERETLVAVLERGGVDLIRDGRARGVPEFPSEQLRRWERSCSAYDPWER